MKKVLFISYGFPPMGGGGVFRITKFIKYLAEFGVEARVLTVKNHFYPYQDETLLQEIPNKVQVTRINYNDPACWIKARWWQSFLFYGYYPWFSISDQRVSWIKPAIAAAIQIIKKEKIDTIFTSFAPASDHLIAMEVKRQTGVNWVADFRDEWASTNYLTIPTPLHRDLIKDLEEQVAKTADKIITVSPPLTAYFAKISGNRQKCVTITNGFDSEDFSAKIDLLKRDYCQILYAGTFYGERSADTFNEAVSELNLPDLKVEFIGGKNQVEHSESVKLQQQADILLLVLSPNDRPAVFTGKIFEYLAARRPILCLAPKNTAAAHLINELGIGVVVEPTDKEGIKRVIKRMYEAWKIGALVIPRIDLKPYDRRYLTERLAGIFKSLPEIKAKLMLVANTLQPQVRNLADYLIKQNYQLYFVSLDGSKINNAQNYSLDQKKLVNYFTPWYLIAGFWQKYRALKKLRKIITEVKPDLIHSHVINFAGILAYYSGFSPTIVTAHGSDLMQIEKQPSFEQFLIRKTIQNADIVTGNSMALHKKALQLGINSKKWREVYFGIDLDIFKPKDSFSLKKELKFTDEKIIFSPRSLKPIYNIDVLLKAVAGLGNKNWKLVMIKRNQDEKYFQYLKQLITELNLEDRIIFLLNVDAQKMANLYNLSDVVVSIAQSDGAASTFLEAMASEAKIVVSDVEFVKEWSDGNFWVVPIGDEQKTTEAIEEALKISKTDFRLSGQKNRQIIADRAEINSSFKKFEEIYEELTK